MGVEQIACIDLHDFDARLADIAQQIARAAVEVGFLQVYNHGMPQSLIDEQFRRAEQFFSLSDEVKARESPFLTGKNKGWEKGKQVRPSSGVADLKESLQIGWQGMEANWPSDDVTPGFQKGTIEFMHASQTLSKRLLTVLAIALQLPADFFTKVRLTIIELVRFLSFMSFADKEHNELESDCLATLRLLHYGDITGSTFPAHYWRAAPHSDFDTITLLFQRPGQDGLEACPGASATTAYGLGDDWTPVQPREGMITVNFGRMLTRWTDDKVRATLHRVRTPRVGENQKSRYSIAYFNQANGNSVIHSPNGSYPDITGYEFLRQALQANYATKYREGEANDSPLLLEEKFRQSTGAAISSPWA